MAKHPALAGIVGGVVGTVLVGAAVWLTIVYTGAYNVAASDQHADAVRWTLDTTMRRSVANRAEDVGLPASFSAEVIADGAEHYAAYCAHCHGAPGQEPAEWSRGMRPEPPHLTEAASEWSAEEIRWIVSNGIKMSGMPAFGDHGEKEVLALTAFVTTLPGLSAGDYAEITGSTEGHEHEEPDGHEGGGAEPASD